MQKFSTRAKEGGEIIEIYFHTHFYSSRVLKITCSSCSRVETFSKSRLNLVSFTERSTFNASSSFLHFSSHFVDSSFSLLISDCDRFLSYWMRDRTMSASLLAALDYYKISNRIQKVADTEKKTHSLRRAVYRLKVHEERTLINSIIATLRGLPLSHLLQSHLHLAWH